MNAGLTLIQMFDKTASRYPDKVAVCMNDEKVTYSCLQKWAMSIASEILNRGLETSKPVVIAMNKSPKCLAALIGVLYSGRAYTILDVKSPIIRIEKILSTLGSQLIIADAKGKKTCSESSIIDKDGILLVDDAIDQAINYEEISRIQKSVVDTDPAYVLFTSGSTGVPKGTVVGHRSVIAYTRAIVDTFSIDEFTVFGNQTPFYFSMSVLDIFVTLYTGATLVIIPKMLFSFPLRLFEYMRDNKVDTIYWVPTAMELVADRNLFSQFDSTFLKAVLFAGEPLPTKYLNIWKDALPEALFANLYGPTEVTDTCTYYICNSKLDETSSIPIGKSFYNCDVFLLDDNNHKISTKSCDMGEICVRGSFLAYGYYNNFEQTQKAFVNNPVNRAYDELIYRTGDLGKWGEDGNLIYCGRKDYQIKHLGYRIELGEIENVIASVNGVNMVVVIYNDAKDEIAACFTGNTDEETFLAEASGLLPTYMRPTKVLKYDSFPVNANGKIDRKAIKERLLEN